MEKKSISVMEMGRLLGIKKTDAYWLIKKGLFEVILVAEKNALSLIALKNGLPVNHIIREKTNQINEVRFNHGIYSKKKWKVFRCLFICE